MDMYNNALYDGKLYHLHIEDCMRLIELQKMMSRSNSNQFYIPEKVRWNISSRKLYQD